MDESLEIERILDFVIALFPDEDDQESVGEHAHNERKVDKAIRLIEEGDNGMNPERVTRVVLCGSVLSCEFDDRISIEFSPDELRRLTELFVRRALNAVNYSQQGFEREMKETYSSARELWREERDKR